MSLEFLDNISLLNNESIPFDVRRSSSSKISDYPDMSIDAASPDSTRVPAKRPNKPHVPSACVSQLAIASYRKARVLQFAD